MQACRGDRWQPRGAAASWKEQPQAPTTPRMQRTGRLSQTPAAGHPGFVPSGGVVIRVVGMHRVLCIFDQCRRCAFYVFSQRLRCPLGVAV